MVAAKGPRDVSGETREPFRTLFIHQDGEWSEQLEQNLQKRDHDVVSLADSSSAWEAYLRGNIDIVILGDFLPEEEGSGLIRKIRTHPNGNYTVILGAASRENPDRVKRLTDMDVNHVILFPADPEQLELLLHLAEKNLLSMKKHQCAQEQLLRYKKALDTMQLGVTITDRDGKIIYVNPADADMHGYKIDELVGEYARFFGQLENWKPLKEIHFERMKRWKRESVNTRRDGTDFPVQLMSDVVTDLEGNPVGIVTTCEDITERIKLRERLEKVRRDLEKRAEERTSELTKTVQKLKQEIAERKKAETALRVSEERYALAAKGANDGLWDWNLTTGEFYCSPRWMAMLGMDQEEGCGTLEVWLDRVLEEDRERLEHALTQHVEGVVPHFEQEYRIMHEDGKIRWMLSRGLALRDENGKAYRVAGSQNDITARKKFEEQLLHDALHDSLTGLPNRALFMDRLDHAIEREKRNPDYTFAVLFLDLDHFKIINDSLGHLLGDRLLVQIAERLKTCVRAVDTIARFGGDEFTILLEEIRDISDAKHVAARISQVLEDSFSLEDHEVYTTASVGIAPSIDAHSTPEDLIRDADTAMYRAKAKGGTCHVVFDQTMHDQVVRRLKIETELRKAMEREEFVLHYQPIISLKNGRLSGFETLVRWNRPGQGCLLPGEFIGIAEETGLIISLGEWVFLKACRQFQQWRKECDLSPDFWISINISRKQFTHANLLPAIDRVLRETGTLPRQLCLEITESMIMENPEWAMTMLQQFSSMGLSVAIDDFGTGHSSLSSLHDYPIDILKIDRSFVSGIDSEKEGYNIIPTILMLARNLKMNVVAEGIETTEQLFKLKNSRCDYAQGFLLERAVDAETATVFFSGKKNWLEEFSAI